MTYALDDLGEKWVEHEISNNDYRFIDFAGDYHYLSFEISGTALETTRYFWLRVKKEEDYFGFLLDIRWNDILPDGYDYSYLREKSKMLISFVEELFNFTKFSYATIGHELDIVGNLTEFKQMFQRSVDYFPIVFMATDIGLTTLEGSFAFDGITDN